MSGVTVPAYLEGIQRIRAELHCLCHLEHTSARDSADLQSSIELLDSIGKRRPVKNGSLVLRLTLLLHEFLLDSKQGAATSCTVFCLTDLFHVGWFQWVDCADMKLSDEKSRLPTAFEIRAICQEIRDFSDDVSFAE